MSDDLEVSETYSIGQHRDRIIGGPIFRTLLWLGVPLLLNQLIVVVYNVADAYWLSLYEEVSIGVPRQVWPVIMLFMAILNALTAANQSTVSQYIGAKNFKEASLSASRFFTVSFITGAAMCTLLLTLREFIFSWLISVPPEIHEDVMKYSAVISFDVFFNCIVFTYATLLGSIGDTKKPAIINGIAVGLNILLDPFLVLGIGPFPRLGVVGASITDVLGKIISMIALAYVIRRKYPDLKIGFTKDIDFEWARLVIRIGLPVLIFGLTNGFAFLFQLKIINLLGIIAATAYSIGFIIMDMVDGALWGLVGANAIMVGQNLGAGNNDRAREISFKSALFLFSIVAIGVVIIYPLRMGMVDIFADDPAIISETELFLRTLLPTLPFFGLFMIAMSTGRGSGHTTFPTLIGILRLWVVRIALGYYLAFSISMGALGAWLAISLSNIVGGIPAILWIKYGGWAKAIIEKKIVSTTSKTITSQKEDN
ncbi:MATE family efflux transporter [Candidatus Bathyarchaeota archaeon]|nr:MATE family efflux transporter [Candidatus Bathyarchaeota archaeon]MBS7630498.1 MATE family efflux transporter [Candidatus Bathyarchaeota archaeon]